MHRILKYATIAKTKRRRLTTDAKIETHHLTTEMFVSGGRRIITIRIDDKVAGHISEWQDKWHYKPSGVLSAKSQAAIGSTEAVLLGWHMQSEGFQIMEDPTTSGI
jgi:hypothetical protein